MIRLAHTALLALLVAVALVSYGAKEEVRAKRAKLGELRAEAAALEAEIATLTAEWRHLSSPSALRALAKRLYGEAAFRAPDGAPLAAWRPDQLLDLSAPVARPALSGSGDRGGLSTGSTPDAN